MLFDFDLEVESDSDEILRANYGFHALVEHRRVPKPLAVSLRVETDFLNVGTLWLEHPHHHLQWDITTGASHPSAYSRIRVPPLLPPEFAEFCLRHFAPELWARRFEHEARQLRDMSAAVNAQTAVAQQEATANQHREAVRTISDEIRAACRGSADVAWQHLDCSTLSL